jgi:hypothetical protein
MNRQILIPAVILHALRTHLFQNELEQAAFLFADVQTTTEYLTFKATEIYFVPPQGWEVQLDVYLQMQESERAKILKMARDKNLALIDCHSHPRSYEDVWFSPSDVSGITDFAAYVKWKLNNKPFAAMVWAETSLDAVSWDGNFAAANAVEIVSTPDRDGWLMCPTGSWFRKPKGKNRYDYES